MKRRHRPLVLRHLDHTLGKTGATWWLSNGAVLGLVRDGDFIATDPDLDIGIRPSDRGRVARRLVRDGWRIRRDYPEQIKARWPGLRCTVDIHVHVPDGERVSYEMRGRHGPTRYSFPAELFDAFELRELHGVRVLVPSPPELYLMAHYGPGWQTPIATWNYAMDAYCVEEVA